MVIRKLSHDDMLSVNELWSVCYLYEANLEAVRKRHEENPVTPYGYGAFLESGELISAVLGTPFEMTFNGQVASLCGIGGVVTHPAHRRLGAVKAIMKGILQEQYAMGTVFSGLYPFNFGFYRKFGYELSAANRETRLPVNQLRPFADSFDVRAFTDKDDVMPLMPVFETFARRYPLAILRKPEAFREKLKPNPFAGNAYLYAIYEENAPVAYVYFHKERENDENLLAVDDFAYLEPKHLRSLLGFLSVMEAEFDNIKLVLPSDVELSALVPDPYSVETKVNNRYMMRVVNCKKALEMLSPAPGESFVISVTDDFLPENGGTWRVSAEGVQKTDKEPDLRMSVQAFSQMLCGFVSFETALLRPDVTLEKYNPALSRLFPARASFVGTYY